MVLDDARNKLANDYGFSSAELRSRRSGISSAVQRIQSRLSEEHASLLSFETLAMIFDSLHNSIRDGGNKAAHEAPLMEHVRSILEATLTETQKVRLSNIYYYIHGEKPSVTTKVVTDTPEDSENPNPET